MAPQCNPPYTGCFTGTVPRTDGGDHTLQGQLPSKRRQGRQNRKATAKPGSGTKTKTALLTTGAAKPLSALAGTDHRHKCPKWEGHVRITEVTFALKSRVAPHPNPPNVGRPLPEQTLSTGTGGEDHAARRQLPSKRRPAVKVASESPKHKSHKEQKHRPSKMERLCTRFMAARRSLALKLVV